MTDIHGINLAMQTPFDDSGGVDFAGLDRLPINISKPDCTDSCSARARANTPT